MQAITALNEVLLLGGNAPVVARRIGLSLEASLARGDAAIAADDVQWINAAADPFTLWVIGRALRRV